MNIEERLESMISNVPEVELTPGEWEDFSRKAHRRLYRDRALIAAASIGALVAVAAGAFFAFDDATPDADLRPVDRQVTPVPVPSDVPTDCPQAPSSRSGERGTVAYLGATELHVVDLSSGDDAILVQGGDGFGEGVFAGDVTISPDRRWIAFGDGLLVPAEGGGVCAPLGRGVRDLQWTPDGRLAAQSEQGLLMIDPDEGGDAEVFTVEGMAIASYALSPDGRTAAVDIVEIADSPEGVTRAGIGLLDLGTGQTTDLVQFDVAPLTASPEVAGWSADGRWVLYWSLAIGTENSVASTGILHGAEVGTGRVVAVSPDHMTADRDQFSVCGAGVALAAGPSGIPAEDQRIFLSTPPEWEAPIFDGLSGVSYAFPSCDASAGKVAATAYPAGSVGSKAPEGTLVVLDLGGGEPALVGERPGASFERPLVTSEGGVLVEIRELGGAGGVTGGGEGVLAFLPNGLAGDGSRGGQWSLGAGPDVALGGPVSRRWDWAP